MDYLNILTACFLGIAGAYILRSLMLVERDSHYGPMQSYTRWVQFPSGHQQPVALFDWIRRLAGVYQVGKSEKFPPEWDVWVVVDSEFSERFTCPHCLSWWTSLLFSIPYSLYAFHLTWALVWGIPIHFAVAVISQLIYGALWPDD